VERSRRSARQEGGHHYGGFELDCPGDSSHSRGALLGVAAGQIRAPDVRSAIEQDLELLDRLPEHQVARREALQRTIDDRIDDLVAANERTPTALRRKLIRGQLARHRALPLRGAIHPSLVECEPRQVQLVAGIHRHDRSGVCGAGIMKGPASGDSPEQRPASRLAGVTEALNFRRAAPTTSSDCSTHLLPQPGRTRRILRSAGRDVSPPRPAALRSAGCR
jgi:hypothetical protein